MHGRWMSNVMGRGGVERASYICICMEHYILKWRRFWVDNSSLENFIFPTDHER